MNERKPADSTTLKLDVNQIYRVNRRIFNLATLGFKESFGNNKVLNFYFLRILIECNKVINELKGLRVKTLEN